MFDILDTKKERKIDSKKLIEFFCNPRKFIKYNLQLKSEDEIPNSDDELTEYYEKISQYVKKTNISLNEIFKFYDHNHNQMLTFEDFNDAIKNSKIPINYFEAQIIFRSLQDIETNLMNYSNFVEKINELLLVINNENNPNEINMPMTVRDLKYRLKQDRKSVV